MSSLGIACHVEVAVQRHVQIPHQGRRRFHHGPPRVCLTFRMAIGMLQGAFSEAQVIGHQDQKAHGCHGVPQVGQVSFEAGGRQPLEGRPMVVHEDRERGSWCLGHEHGAGHGCLFAQKGHGVREPSHLHVMRKKGRRERIKGQVRLGMALDFLARKGVEHSPLSRRTRDPTSQKPHQYQAPMHRLHRVEGTTCRRRSTILPPCTPLFVPRAKQWSFAWSPCFHQC